MLSVPMKAYLALASQGRTAFDTLNLEADELGVLAAHVSDDGVVAQDAAPAVAAVWDAYLQRNKATEEEAPLPVVAATPAPPVPIETPVIPWTTTPLAAPAPVETPPLVTPPSTEPAPPALVEDETITP